MGSLGCRPALHPVHPYNRAWSGEIKLKGRTAPFQIRVFVFSADREASKRSYFGPRVFAELVVGDSGPIAASGQASRHDWTKRGVPSRGYERDREFLELETSTAVLAQDDGKATAQPYMERYNALLTTAGFPTAEGRESRGALVFAAELLDGHTLRGGVYLVESGSGECVHYTGASCDAWNGTSKETQVGTFAASLDASSQVAVPNGEAFETPTFRFLRTSQQNEVGYSIQLR